MTARVIQHNMAPHRQSEIRHAVALLVLYLRLEVQYGSVVSFDIFDINVRNSYLNNSNEDQKY